MLQTLAMTTLSFDMTESWSQKTHYVDLCEDPQTLTRESVIMRSISFRTPLRTGNSTPQGKHQNRVLHVHKQDMRTDAWGFIVRMSYKAANSLGLPEAPWMRKSMWGLCTLKLNCLFQGKSIASDIHPSPQNKCLEEWLSKETSSLLNSGRIPHALARLSAGFHVESSIAVICLQFMLHLFESDPCLSLKLSTWCLSSSTPHLVVSMDLLKSWPISPHSQEKQ